MIGTANILEALRISNHECSAIIITSDKAYNNVEQVWGYKENDEMGGRIFTVDQKSGRINI